MLAPVQDFVLDHPIPTFLEKQYWFKQHFVVFSAKKVICVSTWKTGFIQIWPISLLPLRFKRWFCRLILAAPAEVKNGLHENRVCNIVEQILRFLPSSCLKIIKMSNQGINVYHLGNKSDLPCETAIYYIFILAQYVL